MADLAATDVTFAPYDPASAPLAPQRRMSGGPMPRITAPGVISFGDGSKTYPAGGIPISNINLSMPSFVENITFPDPTDGGSGKLWTFDIVNQKIRGYTALNTEVSGAVAATTLDAIITGF